MASATTKTLPPDEKITMGTAASRLKKVGFGLGVVGLGAGLALGASAGDGWRRFQHSYLLNFMFVLSIGLGALFFVVLQHLVRAKWSVVVRRLAECLTGAFPVLLLLSLGIVVPLVAGSHALYEWADEAKVATDHVLHAKAGYLNSGFFAVRVAIYFGIWLAISQYFFRTSVAQDASGDARLSERMRVVSAPSMIAFALTTAFAAFDLLMSLHPHWFSTMFGVYYFAGCAISIFAVLLLMTIAMHRSGRLTRAITVEHEHDLGKLLFAFVFFWGYVAFSQFMLIWAANLPEETAFFRPRLDLHTDGGLGWGWVSIVLVVGHFAVPFVGLISRNVKRRWWLVGAWATYMLGMHWIDLFWLVMPAFDPSRVRFHLLDLVLLVGMVGFFLAAVAHHLGRVKLVAVGDPGLGESLKFENM